MAKQSIPFADLLGFIAYMTLVGGRLPDRDLLRSVVTPPATG
jgi:hypothetical protein